MKSRIDSTFASSFQNNFYFDLLGSFEAGTPVLTYPAWIIRSSCILETIENTLQDPKTMKVNLFGFFIDFVAVGIY